MFEGLRAKKSSLSPQPFLLSTEWCNLHRGCEFENISFLVFHLPIASLILAYHLDRA